MMAFYLVYGFSFQTEQKPFRVKCGEFENRPPENLHARVNNTAEEDNIGFRCCLLHRCTLPVKNSAIGIV